MALLSSQLSLGTEWISAVCLVIAAYLLVRSRASSAIRISRYVPHRRVVRYSCWLVMLLLLLVDSLDGDPFLERKLLPGNETHIDVQLKLPEAFMSSGSSRQSRASVPKALVANTCAFLVAAIVALIFDGAHFAIKLIRYSKLQPRTLVPAAGLPKNVLIIHGSVGAGHKRAAEALKDGFAERHPDLAVTVVDIIDFGGPIFTMIYKDGYMNLAEGDAGSHLLGYFFDAANKHRPSWFKRVLQELFLLDFLEYLYLKSPDVIVNTHFLSVEIIAGLRRRNLLRIPQVTVITDYDAHAFWANSPTETFFVGQQGAVDNLTYINKDIRPESVIVSGIPTVPAFSKLPQREACIANLGLKGNVGPIVILTASGARYQGRPSIFTLYVQALSVSVPLEIVVVTGRQKDLRDELQKMPVPSHHAVKLEGFTTVMHEYMQAADIIVTKPGGLTTAESLITGLAMVVVTPYPGQEMRNADNLLEAGVAIKCNDLYMLGSKLEVLVRDKERLARMKQVALQMGRARAVFDICDHVASGKYRYLRGLEGADEPAAKKQKRS